jgi:YD repeat-containing protein
VQSELVSRDDDPTQTARRTQKVYEDILGRVYKTEVLNWNASVYSTVVERFNVRDQVLSTRQYAGAENLFNQNQTTSMTYDGHGRLKTQHLPEQDENKNTTYNSDDSISSVTDARGASAIYNYNGRGLLEQISYGLPNPNPTNIQTAPTVSFSYDAVGNRTQMTDGLGTQTYAYDQLSRLTSETRSFTGLIPKH